MELLKDVASAFYSRPFYSHIAHETKGVGIRHILLLSVIMLLMTTTSLLRGYSELRSAINQMPAVVKDLPAITYKDYKLTIDKPAPFRISMGQAPNNWWIFIDPNYVVDDPDKLIKFMRDGHILVLLTTDKMLTLKEPRGELDITSLRDLKPFSVTHDDWQHYGEIIQTWGLTIFLILLYLGLIIGITIYNFIATLLTAVAVKIADFFLHAELDFPRAMRVAAVFRIPAVILCMLPLLFGAAEFNGAVAWFLWGAYGMYAIWSSKHYHQLPE